MNKIISVLIGIACIIIGIFILVTHFKRQNVQTAETTATIIRVDSNLETDSDGFETRYYYPVVEYTVNNQKYETRLPDSGSTNSTEYKEGDTVTCFYTTSKGWREIRTSEGVLGYIKANKLTNEYILRQDILQRKRYFYGKNYKPWRKNKKGGRDIL